MLMRLSNPCWWLMLPWEAVKSPVHVVVSCSLVHLTRCNSCHYIIPRYYLSTKIIQKYYKWAHEMTNEYLYNKKKKQKQENRADKSKIHIILNGPCCCFHDSDKQFEFSNRSQNETVFPQLQTWDDWPRARHVVEIFGRSKPRLVPWSLLESKTPPWWCYDEPECPDH